MAEPSPRDERTEDPTPHRLAEARREGNVPFSREPAQALILVAALLWGVLILPGSALALGQSMKAFLAQAGELGSADLGTLLDRAGALVGPALATLAPLCALVILSPIASALAQRSVVFSLNKLSPDLSRLDPIKGAGRIVSQQSLVEFAKSVLKVAVAMVIVAWLLQSEAVNILRTVAVEPTAALHTLAELARRLLVGVVGLAVVLAGTDVIWQYFLWWRNLKMSRQELKDELRSTEGNPEIKGRLRQMQRERSRRRMLADVPAATVVITNPTHFAVALAYHQEREPVPRVLAKGRDVMAAKIRDLARESGVAIVNDPPVARMLHAHVEIGETIRPEHYRAVAAIVGYVLNRRGQNRPVETPGS